MCRKVTEHPIYYSSTIDDIEKKISSRKYEVQTEFLIQKSQDILFACMCK